MIRKLFLATLALLICIMPLRLFAAELFTTSLIHDANLELYYRFENNVTDSSTHGRNGVNKGSPTFSAGKYGQAINYNGSTQYTTTTPAAINWAGDFTIVFWFKNNGSTAFSFGEVTSNGTTGMDLCYGLTVTGCSAHQFRFFKYNGGQNITYIDNIDSDTTWHQVAYQQGGVGVGMNFYLDGQLVADNTTFTTHPTNPNIPWAIGAGNGAGSYRDFFTGSIDDYAIFSEVLTSAQILTLYNNALICHIKAIGRCH